MNRRQFLTRCLSVLAAPLAARAFCSRAIDVVHSSNVVDMLGLVTLNWPKLYRWHANPAAFTAVDFAKLRSSGIRVFHPAVSLGDGQTHALTFQWFEKWNRLITKQPQYFLRIDSPADIDRARSQGKVGILLGMQDANHFRTVDDVNASHAQGQRLTQLTYNGACRLGNGCYVASDKGLTAFGQDVIARMNSIGMAVDVSHCGERTSLDAIAASKKPVLITHSNCRALASNVSRCKSDDVIRAASRNGGVLGITSVRNFVRNSGPSTVDDVLDHFDHAVKLVGVEHVGLGSDFDLDPHPSYDTPGLNEPSRVYALADGLVRRGYKDADISLMLGGNFARAFQQICSV